jgi:MOSC domain-containing protein YiiM
MNSAGQLAGIYLASKRGAGKTACTSAELIAGHGLQGDAHAGTHPHRHLSLFTQETVQALQSEGFSAAPGELSANLFISGLPLDSLPLGTQLRIGPVLLEISEPRKPCRSITRIDHRLPKRLFGQCGQFARVLVGGKVQVGDIVELITGI